MTKATDFAALIADAKSKCSVNGMFDTDATMKRIDSIRSRGQKLDADIHAVAVACLHFAMPESVNAECGRKNAEPARQLLSAMPKGSRAQTLADWFEAHSNVSLTRGKDGKWSAGIAKGEKAKPDEELLELASKADARPFWDVAEKTGGAKAFDLNVLMIRLFAEADKAIAAGSIDDDMLDNVVSLREFAKAKGLPTEKPKKIAA